MSFLDYVTIIQNVTKALFLVSSVFVRGVSLHIQLKSMHFF